MSEASPVVELTSRERFVRACRGEPVDRAPCWIMRQAGRYLPEYRALKEQHSFTEMVRTPDLAVEVTLQPLRRYAFDAAIVFSDILIVPEALGQGYRFLPEGLSMDFRLETPKDLERLRTAEGVTDHIDYIAEAQRRLRTELGDTKAVLGFAGSPWTLATYMIAGPSPANYGVVKKWIHEAPADLDRLLDLLVEAVARTLRLQIDAGADAVQIFDSNAAVLAGHLYERWSLRFVQRVIAALPPETPVILFAKGKGSALESLKATGARVLSLDASVDLSRARQRLGPDIGLQGNLDPEVLNLAPESAAAEARALRQRMANDPAWVTNLGHGILPQANPESVAAVVEAWTEAGA